jgi:uncharacterized repeat protein (TIGR03803 family)
MPSVRTSRTSSRKYLSVFVIAAALIIACGGVAASSKERVLYSFRGGSDGATPYSTLIADGAGNLYGTTSAGGGGTCEFGGCGTVFKLAPDGTESVLHPFTGAGDGAYPMAGLISDTNGNLYGTASEGGADGWGTVFMVTPNGTETTLYSFQDGSDGAYPVGSLMSDQHGNLYGTAEVGGARSSDCSNDGCGVVFQATTAGKESVRYAFQGGTDGWDPVGSLISDSSGNLYGVTTLGGANCANSDIGCGTVFKVAPDGTETQLHIFQGGSDGEVPYAGLISDMSGNFYGTTAGGGSGSTYCVGGCGTVYKIAPDGTETVLYSFQGGSDGSFPRSSLILDKAGNLYGTTYDGDGFTCKGGPGCGTVFKVAPDGKETVLYAFHNRRGTHPVAGLLSGPHGKFYGTATEGGMNNDGVVFVVKK